MGVRRVVERLPALELLRHEPADVMSRGVRDGARVGLEGLHEHTARRVAAASARELRDQLERALLGAEVGHREPRVRVDHRGELDSREVMALRDHLRAEQHGRFRLGEPSQGIGELLRLRDRIRVEPDQLQLGQLTRKLTLELLRACSEPARSGEPHAGQFEGASVA